MPLKETITNTIKSEVSYLRDLTKAALASRAYLYPLRGIYYFATHRQLWAPLTSRLLPLFALSIAVVVPMFIFTYIPQSFLLTFVNGPLAWIYTVALVLEESAAIVTALSKGFLLEEALQETWQRVLEAEGCTQLAREKEVKAHGWGEWFKKPGKLLDIQALVRYFLYLPLNFIPVVGTAAFFLMQGRQQGPSFHERYFELKKFSRKQREEWVQRNVPAYIAFGTVAVLLQMIPAAGILFLFTNTVGAALWAAEMEKKGVAPPKGEEGKKEL